MYAHKTDRIFDSASLLANHLVHMRGFQENYLATQGNGVKKLYTTLISGTWA
jgi:hypothetical protein